MNKNMLKSFAVLFVACLTLTSVQAQSDRVHIGVLGGYHGTSASYSNLDKRIFDSPKGKGGLAGGIFAEFELGDARAFSLRPELVFLSRSFAIEDISYLRGTGYGELDYNLSAQYTDLRLPIIYNFGSPYSIRPYIYVAPVLGLVRGGEISAEDNVDKYTVDVSKANMASTYFAGQIGVGVKFPIGIGSEDMHLGIEANYELGFTDTYADKEKRGRAYSKLFFPVYDISGTRKFSGFEVMATLSVPLSVFGHSKSSPRPVQVVVQQPDTRRPAAVVKERPCYTLEEIVAMVDRGERVSGKTICAMEQINFEYNKSTISRKSYAYLDKIATFLVNTKNKVEVRGHTDNRGSAEYNMKLSKERAAAVYNYLLQKGVSADRLTYSYYGYTQPIASNDTEEGRRQNRRVEFVIK